jgi:hypothetical protein
MVWAIILFSFAGGTCFGMWLESSRTVAKYRKLKAEHDAAMASLEQFLEDR